MISAPVRADQPASGRRPTRSSTGARMLATTTSNVPSTWSTSWSSTSIRSRDAVHARHSPPSPQRPRRRCRWPARWSLRTSAATIDSTPVPHPTSSTEIDASPRSARRRISARNARALSCDVGWSPSPNAPAGSITHPGDVGSPRRSSIHSGTITRSSVIQFGSGVARAMSPRTSSTRRRHATSSPVRACAARAVDRHVVLADRGPQFDRSPIGRHAPRSARTPSCQSRSLARSTSLGVDRDDERTDRRGVVGAHRLNRAAAVPCGTPRSAAT